MSGYRSLGDGGEGNLVLDPADTSSPTDHCTVFLDSVGNRFKRLASTMSKYGVPREPVEINFYQCGAYGNGSTDDSAAIKYAISAAGTIGGATNHFARLICPGGTFLATQIVISAAYRIELVGQHVGGVAGCQIKSSSPNADLLTIQADTFKMENVFLLGDGAGGSGSGNCLVLGVSGGQILNDTSINNSWLANCNGAGIKLVNVQNLVINNTTFDQLYGNAINATITSGNVAMNVTISASTINGSSTSPAAPAAIYLSGTASTPKTALSNWVFSGTAFTGLGTSAACSISIQQANAISFVGNRFSTSGNSDICATNVSNLVINSNVWTNGGGAALSCSGCSATTFNDNNGNNMFLGYPVGYASGIVTFSGTGANNVVLGNNFVCTSPHAQYGLLIVSTTTNTGVGPNLFACDTVAASSVSGTKAWNY